MNISFFRFLVCAARECAVAGCVEQISANGKNAIVLARADQNNQLSALSYQSLPCVSLYRSMADREALDRHKVKPNSSSTDSPFSVLSLCLFRANLALPMSAEIKRRPQCSIRGRLDAILAEPSDS